MSTPTTQEVPDPISGPERRTVGDRIGGLLLGIGAMGGVVCIIAVVLAWLFGITLIMFKTGSMAPTIPTGSVSMVRQIPAAQIEVGDVVTVDRSGQLPVTHRVRSVEAGPGDARTIVLRGDANTSDDPAPYVVSSVRLVIFSVPGLARVIVWFGNPFALGGVTLGAAALVLWAFWPRGDFDRKSATPRTEYAPEEPLASDPARSGHPGITSVGTVEETGPTTAVDQDVSVGRVLVPTVTWTAPPAPQRLPSGPG